jgi:hypothetical protein
MGRNYRKRKADDDADDVEVAEPVPSEEELRCAAGDGQLNAARLAPPC